jgi:hypothetical protein
MVWLVAWQISFLRSFAKQLQEATISLVISVCMEQATPTRLIFLEFHISDFYEKGSADSDFV